MTAGNGCHLLVSFSMSNKAMPFVNRSYEAQLLDLFLAEWVKVKKIMAVVFGK
jgi:hypothetical protein